MTPTLQGFDGKRAGMARGDVSRQICHGSSVVVEVPRLVSTRYTKDFGPGFYICFCTERALETLKFSGSEEVFDG